MKGNYERRANNNSLSIKQIQGPLVPPQGLVDNILSHIL